MIAGIRRGLGLETVPEKGVPRTLCVQSGIWAFGFGAFLAGSAVFFTTVVGLSAAQVAFGIGVANLAGLAVTTPLGVLADKIGYRRSWIIAALVEGAVMFAYPAIRSFALYLAAVVVIGLARSLGNSGQSAYGLEMLPEEIRVRTFAYMRATLNIGLAAGALVSGIALAIGTRPAILATPLIFAIAMVVNAIAIGRLPADARPAKPGGAGETGAAARRSALRDVRFLVLALVNGLLTSYSVLVAAIIPLWAVTGTRAPHLTTAVVYVVNTGLVVLLQVRATRGAESPAGPGRLLRITGVAFLLACVALVLSHGAGPVTALLLIVLATVCLTGAELWQSAASWSLLSRLAPPEQRGAYSGVWGSGVQLQSVVAPAAFIWLVAGANGLGWLLIGVVLLALGLLSPALVRWTELGRTAPRPVPENA